MLAFVSAFVLLSATPPANDTGAAPRADSPDVQLVIGSNVEARAVVPFNEGQEPGAGESVYAWTQLKGFGDDAVTQVWTRDGAEVARHTLAVKSSRRWRTWSHNRVQAGAYEVRVLAADGRELAKQAFTVGAADANGEE